MRGIIFHLYLAILLGMTLAPVPTQGQANITEKDSRVQIENEWVRVLRVTHAPHEKGAMRDHPTCVVVYLTDSQQRITSLDGTVQELTRKTGEIYYSDAGRYAVENLSDQPAQTVLVELKPAPRSQSIWPLPLDPARLDPQYVSVLFENDRIRVLRVIHEPHIKSPLHEHPRYVVVYLTEMDATMTLADGKQVNYTRKPGDVAWRDPLKHVTENNHEGTEREVEVELK